MSAAFRLFTPFQTFFDLKGQPCALGSLVFYQSGTTTPADVYGDEALTVNNGSTIALGTDGRPVDDIWGNINYRARLYDVNGTLVDDLPDIQIPGGTGLTIPTLESGAFLTNDGSVLAWEDIGQVPDPTGSSGKFLSTDGVNFTWTAIVPPTLDATVTANSLKVTATGGTFLTQCGTDTAPASGTYTTTKAITFPIPFTTCLHASAQPLTNSNPGGPMVSYPSSAASGTGVTFVFDIAEGNSSQSNVVNPVPFTWVAHGIV